MSLSAATAGIDSEEAKLGQLTVPVFSTKWAIGLCICNFLVPGLATIPALPAATSANLPFGVALLQLLLTPLCFLGWIWSCVWGCTFIAKSNPEWRARRRVSRQPVAESSSPVTSQPSASSSRSSYLGLAASLQSQMRQFRAGRGLDPALGMPLLPPPEYRGPEDPADSPPSYEEAVREAEQMEEQQ
uniref:Transmembrane protein n=1 Tax=Macrostomum lignano TaxID=282301 RepID=A0A1I8HQE5_9PLAT